LKAKQVIALYEKKKEEYGKDAYRHISELLDQAKLLYRKDWMKRPTPNKDFEQSWKPFKGNALEKLLVHILKGEVESLGLQVVGGRKLERTKSENLSRELSAVKHNLLVDYGEFGSHMPDVDLIIYDPTTYKVLGVISSKVTLRERIAQTGYWKIKLSRDKAMEHIKVFFVTPDEDGDLTTKTPSKKGRAIVEVDTDGSYVMSKAKVEESCKVKTFDKFVDDLKRLVAD